MIKLPDNPDIRILSETYGKRRKGKSGPRTRKAGHIHALNAQDFPFNPPPPIDELRTQARMALLLMQPHAEAAGVVDATPYVTAVAALKNLMEYLK